MDKTNFRLRKAVTCCLFYLVLMTARAHAANDTLVFVVFPVACIDTTVKDTIPSDYYRLNAAYLRSFPRDLKRVVLRPGHWDKRDFRRVALVAAGTGLIMLSDREIKAFMIRNQTPAVDEITSVVEPFGNTFPPLILSGLYVAGLITHNRKLEHVALASAKSLAISTVIYIGTKSLIRRQRPFRTDNPFNFGAPFKKDYTSFPSGHTNTVVSVATALSLEYKHVPWVPYVSYSIATLTALSRLYQNRHWSSDVFFGAALSHFVTKAVYNRATHAGKEKIVIP